MTWHEFVLFVDIYTCCTVKRSHGIYRFFRTWLTQYLFGWCRLSYKDIHTYKRLYYSKVGDFSVIGKHTRLHLDNHLNWKEQVNTICKRLNSTIALLKRINCYLCPEMKTMFYNSYFMSISDYCCFIWVTRKDCSHKITLIQKRAAIIILNKPARTPFKPLFKELKWQM